MSSLPPPLPPPQPVPKRGMSGCAITAIVAGVLIGLVIVGIAVGSYVVVKKVGGRSGVAKTAIGMANPDYEIIELNEQDKTITVRHKKTGKTATFPISHMREGHIDPADLGMSPTEAEGTGGAPEWVKYPRGRQVQAAQLLGITTLVYRTADPPDKVLEYYKSFLANKGIQTSTAGNGAIVVAGEKGSLQIATSGGPNGETQISIVYRGR